jgi:divalent metal cation (Fe/Co/Zn/Cd) transporter
VTPRGTSLPLGPLAASAVAAVLMAAGFVGLFGSIRSNVAPGLVNPDAAKALIAVGLLLEGWAAFGLYQFAAARRERSPGAKPGIRAR